MQAAKVLRGTVKNEKTIELDEPVRDMQGPVEVTVRPIGPSKQAPLSETLKAIIPGAPAVEIGWQLGKEFWGHGYAPEGARAMLDFAWWKLRLREVVAITYEGNLPSRRVMEKLGMTYDERADFLHPDVPASHTLQPHVLYRIINPALRD